MRPEVIELVESRFLSAEAPRIDGKILASAYQGAFVEYEIAALGKALKARVTNPKEKYQFKTGDEVALTSAPAHVLVVAQKRADRSQE